MNRRDFLEQFGLIATLPLIGLTPAFGDWKGQEWPTITAAARVETFDGRIAGIWMVSEALQAEEIEALYQQSRQWFEG